MDKLIEIGNSRNTNSRIKRLERLVERDAAHLDEGPIILGVPVGGNNVPIIDVADMTRLVIAAYDGSGNYRPYIRVNISGEYSTVRGFIGYAVRVIPAIGAVFVVTGPVYPATATPINIHNLPSPPRTNEAWRVQARVLTGNWGPGAWSDFKPVTWGGDPDAPASPTYPAGWLVKNLYNETEHITETEIDWNDNTEPDLDKYVLESSTDAGVSWHREPPISYETTRYSWAGYFDTGAVVSLRLLRQDTSGNQSGWTAFPNFTVPVPVPAPINRWIFDGGFELDKGWVRQATGPGDPFIIPARPASGYEGVYCFQATNTHATLNYSYVGLSTRFSTINQGLPYRLSAWAKGVAGTGGVSNISLVIYYFDSTDTFLSSVFYSPAIGVAGTWNKYTSPVLTPPANAVKIKVAYHLTPNLGGGSIYIDDIDLLEILPGTSIQNGVITAAHFAAIGYTGTINLAKLTVAGTNGSLTIANGIITARVDPT